MEINEIRIDSKVRFPSFGVPHLVQVVDPERPWLTVELHVYERSDTEIATFRLAEVHLYSENLDEAAPTSLLMEGAWWSSILKKVLEHLAFKSTEFDRAAERGGDTFTYLYGWEDGEVQEAEFTTPGSGATE